MKNWTVPILLTIYTLTGCAALDAWKTGLGYNHKTGQATAEVKGASKGGTYQEKKGLNIDLGDNTVAALGIAAGLGVLSLVAYPVQRSLRLRKERKWRERLNENPAD